MLSIYKANILVQTHKLTIMKTLMQRHHLHGVNMRSILIVIGLIIGVTGLKAQTIACSFYWTYKQHVFAYEWLLDYKSYTYYREQPKDLPYENYAIENQDHRYFFEIGKNLNDIATEYKLNNEEFVDFLVAFVQQAIQYKSDPANYPYDYPKYPIETLVEGSGDCEDKSILLSVLLNMFGYASVLVLLPENQHMAVAVECTGTYKKYFDFNPAGYFTYIETTGPGWKVGDVPQEYRTENPEVLAIPKLALYQARQ